ncbi:MAG: hypothetical protein CW342_07735 [Thermoactinomycetaceae bacterium]|nr:hypothetical protein [Bacillota bacterium]MBO2532765.1 hypothetical protein [Thermoactinomycetaceae bacterium]
MLGFPAFSKMEATKSAPARVPVLRVGDKEGGDFGGSFRRKEVPKAKGPSSSRGAGEPFSPVSGSRGFHGFGSSAASSLP